MGILMAASRLEAEVLAMVARREPTFRMGLAPAVPSF